MQAYMREQTERVDRQWVSNVLAGTQETECIKLRTPAFVILPDIVPDSRYSTDLRCSPRLPERERSHSLRRGHPPLLNWLAIVVHPALRTIRDLRGEHLEMLRTLQAECIALVTKEFNVDPAEIMIFANYPPSVYTLHFHIACPLKITYPFDAFRMHTIESVIHHLDVDPEYYAKHNLHIPVSNSCRLYHALMDTPPPPSTANPLAYHFRRWKLMTGAGIPKASTFRQHTPHI